MGRLAQHQRGVSASARTRPNRGRWGRHRPSHERSAPLGRPWKNLHRYRFLPLDSHQGGREGVGRRSYWSPLTLGGPPLKAGFQSPAVLRHWRRPRIGCVRRRKAAAITGHATVNRMPRQRLCRPGQPPSRSSVCAGSHAATAGRKVCRPLPALSKIERSGAPYGQTTTSQSPARQALAAGPYQRRRYFMAHRKGGRPRTAGKWGCRHSSGCRRPRSAATLQLGGRDDIKSWRIHAPRRLIARAERWPSFAEAGLILELPQAP